MDYRSLFPSVILSLIALLIQSSAASAHSLLVKARLEGTVRINSATPVQESMTDHAPGSIVTIEAMPGPGYYFTGWIGDASGLLANTRVSSATFTINRDLVLDAAFSSLAGIAIGNGDFSDGASLWTAWVHEDTGGGFSASALDGGMRVEGTHYNGGVYQAFETGGAGNIITVTGWWKSAPAAPQSQWAEILVINADRVPADGVDEVDSFNDTILLFKNDSWDSPSGWEGAIPSTSPVHYAVSFTAAGGRATLVLKAGDSISGGTTGVIFDNMEVRSLPPPGSGLNPPDAFAMRTATLPVTRCVVLAQHPDPDNRGLFTMKNNGASPLYRIDPETLAAQFVVNLAGIPGITFENGAEGMTFDSAGNLYIASHEGDILKGTYNPATQAFTWSKFLNLPEDQVGGWHGVNGLAVDESDTWLYICSGSLMYEGGPDWSAKTDYSNRVLRIPLAGGGLAAVEVFCDGIRNNFDLVFRSDGLLFGVDNGPECDFADEFNLLLPGRHYGWSYNYGSDLSGSDAVFDAACVIPAPTNVIFTPNWANYGPDGRPGPGEPGYQDGGIYYGLTPHSSPDGLSFYDTSRMDPFAKKFPLEYHGRAFIACLGNPAGPGLDVITLRLDDANSAYVCNTFQNGLGQVVDVLCAWNGRVYALEYAPNGGGNSRILEFRYTGDEATWSTH